MKKHLRTLLIISGACCLVGMLLCLISFGVLGFDVHRLDTVGIHSGTLDIGADMPGVDVSVIRQIEVDTSSCDVTVCPSPDGKFRVVYETPEYIHVTANIDGNRLIVNALDTSARQPWYKHIRLQTRPYKGVTVYIPLYNLNRSYEAMSVRTTSGDILLFGGIIADTASIKTTSGDVDVRIDTNNTLDITTVSGDVDLALFTAKDVAVKTTSGDITLAHLSVQGSIALQTTSGEVEASSTQAAYFTAQTTSGDIELTQSGAEVAMLLRTVSGEVDVLANRQYLLYTETVSGEVHVKRHAQVRQNAANCKVFTTSGDISVA